MTPAQKCQHDNQEAENSKHKTSLASSTNQRKLSGLKIIQVCSKIYLELGKKLWDRAKLNRGKIHLEPCTEKLAL